DSSAFFESWYSSASSGRSSSSSVSVATRFSRFGGCSPPSPLARCLSGSGRGAPPAGTLAFAPPAGAFGVLMGAFAFAPSPAWFCAGVVMSSSLARVRGSVDPGVALEERVHVDLALAEHLDARLGDGVVGVEEHLRLREV